MGEAVVPGCARCGAPLAIDPNAEGVLCAHCGQDHRVDDALRARMLAYVGEIAAAAQGELKARWVALFYENNHAATGPFVVGAVGVSIAVVAWMGLLAIGTVSLPTLLGSVLVTAACTAALGWGFRRVFAMPTMAALERFESVRCAGCGGYSAFAAGKPVSACAYCGGHRLVPTRVVSSAIAHARAASREAGERVGKEWDRAVAAGDRLVLPMVALVVMAVVVGMPALGALELMVLRDVLPLPAGVGLALVLAHAGVEGALAVRAMMRTSGARVALEREVARLAEEELAKARARALAPPALGDVWSGIVWKAFAESPRGEIYVHDGALVMSTGAIPVRARPAAAMDWAPVEAVLGRGWAREHGLEKLAWDAAEQAWIAPGGVKLGARYVEALRALGPELVLRSEGVHDPVVLVRGGAVIGALMPLR